MRLKGEKDNKMHRNSAVHFFVDTEKTLVFAFRVPYNRGVPYVQDVKKENFA